MKSKIRLGIIGTGGMAHDHARNFAKIPGVQLVSCCDIVEDKAKKFGQTFSIPGCFGDLDTMLDSGGLDAVSIVTTDSSHAAVALKAIERGLHVMCEKPLATNYADAMKMAKAAKRKKVKTAVNFSYRRSAAVQYASKLVQSGKLGRVIHVEASYLQSWLASSAWGTWKDSPQLLWRLSRKHGSNGDLGDIGVHIYDLVSFVAGDFAELNCKLETFDKGVARIGEYVFDANDSFVSSVKFAGGAIGAVHSSRWAVGHNNSLRCRVYGDKGAIEIDLDHSYDLLKIIRGKDGINKALWETIKCPPVPSMYQRFITSIQTGKQGQPDFETGAKVQKYLDASFASDAKKKWIKV